MWSPLYITRACRWSERWREAVGFGAVVLKRRLLSLFMMRRNSHATSGDHDGLALVLTLALHEETGRSGDEQRAGTGARGNHHSRGAQGHGCEHLLLKQHSKSSPPQHFSTAANDKKADSPA